jgi:hypothetical protein
VKFSSQLAATVYLSALSLPFALSFFSSLFSITSTLTRFTYPVTPVFATLTKTAGCVPKIPKLELDRSSRKGSPMNPVASCPSLPQLLPCSTVSIAAPAVVACTFNLSRHLPECSRLRHLGSQEFIMRNWSTCRGSLQRAPVSHSHLCHLPPSPCRGRPTYATLRRWEFCGGSHAGWGQTKP